MNTYLNNNAPIVRLVSCTPCMEETVAVAAEMCYSSKEPDELVGNMTSRKSKYLIDKLSSMGHESPFEHATFTFVISDISRACSHQLVRHRIASYSQRSQRYVDEEGFDYILPPEIENNRFARSQYVTFMARVDDEYNSLKLTLLGGKICEYNNDVESTLWGMTDAEIRKLCEQFKNEHPDIYGKFYKEACEDARYILPNACATQLVCTMNVRSLLNFFSLRCCNRAQWEIHELADKMLAICKEVAPNLFRNAGPSCLSGKCPEGQLSCGRSQEVIEKYKKG